MLVCNSRRRLWTKINAGMADLARLLYIRMAGISEWGHLENLCGFAALFACTGLKAPRTRLGITAA